MYVAGGCSICFLIWKNAIANSSTPTHIIITPMMTIVNAAPIISRRDAVENKPVPDLVASIFSDFLARNAQRIRKIQKITNATSAPANSEKIVLVLMFDVFGVMPESDEIDVHFPFHVG